MKPNQAPKPGNGHSKQGWKMCTKKKGEMNKNNKKPTVEETAIDENRHSRLKHMVRDMTEVTQSLSEAVKQQNNGNDQIESNNKIK